MKSVLVALALSFATLAFGNNDGWNSPAFAENQPQEASAVPFADFDAQIEVEKTEFEVRGGFTLGGSSNGINLFKEDVSFAVGPFAKTIPAGAFKEEKRGKLSYSEATKDLVLDVTIRIIGNNKFSVKIEGESAKVTKNVRPEEITLKIGDDEGRARERVKIGKEN